MAKQPNHQLSAMIERSRLSRGEVARRVHARSLEYGINYINPDATSVRRWCNGEQPRHPLPGIIADVFSAHLGHRVTGYDLGFGDSPDLDRPLLYGATFGETVEAVAELGRADMDRRAFLAAVPFAAAAGVGPSRDWLLNTLDQTPEPGPRVRIEDVTNVKNMFASFQDMDVMQGGGSGRLVLTAYMSEHVYPLLRRAFADDVRRALCAAAAEQTYLLGWMSFDNGEHGTAQRYLIQALRLAEESQDAALGAHVLAGMADQATLLGNPTEGRRLAQAGRQGLAAKAESPACMADLWALEARALAAGGDSKAATHAVAESERVFGTVRPETEPEWAKFIDGAYLHGEYANVFRDLDQPENSAEHARRSIDFARSQGRARRGAMSQAALAVSHLQLGELEAAHSAGVRALDLSRRVQSSRSVEAVQDVRRRMVPFGSHPLVADFNERTRVLLAA
ncbi:transcriptional regulator [Kitasatospora purpeofusca]|uniref:transcriptional regulator n=1 Tax=Kitasatospora purpeofusca TaxID=67352 RepID=UPI0033F75B17